jgi:acetate---CoA ligase (ADP-forming)
MDLKPLFEPRTMAVIGISATNDRHPANVIFAKNSHRYPVEVYAVNPKGGKIHDDKIYPQIADIPGKIDLAVIATRAELVPDVMADCIKAGVRSAAVISGGFTEGGRGDLQQRMVDMAKEAKFPFIGPNCLGVYVPFKVDTFFLPIERMIKPEAGGVTFVSQSGGILVDHMIKFAGQGVGMAKAISIGNKAFIKEKELLAYLVRDPATKVIAYYIEGFGPGEGRDFVLAADRSVKPIVVLKSGKSPGGGRAVSSHTASLAGDYASFSAAIAQHNILEAANENELVSFCEVLSSYTSPIDGNIGIITGSGGHGAMVVDACTQNGIKVPELSVETKAEIEKNLTDKIQAIAALGNPIDLTGSAVDEDFVACAKVLGASEEIDCIIVLLLPYIPGMTLDIGVKLSTVSKQFKKPFIAYVPQVEKYNMLIEGFELNGIPVSPSIEGAVLMAKALVRKKPC